MLTRAYTHTHTHTHTIFSFVFNKRSFRRAIVTRVTVVRSEMACAKISLHYFHIFHIFYMCGMKQVDKDILLTSYWTANVSKMFLSFPGQF